MLEISESSNSQLQYTSSIINGNVDSDVTPTLNETESQPSNANFTLLYEKLCDAIILADRKTQEAILCYCLFGKALMQRRNEIASQKQQVDPESNIVSRILNKEVHNVPFDYSIKVEESKIRCFTSSTLKFKIPEPSSGSDLQNHVTKIVGSNPTSDNENSGKKSEVSTSHIPQVSDSSGSEPSKENDQDLKLLETEISISALSENSRTI
ncbi:21890_t:CDS:2 [Entrophospora sp. SA101]|nr:21890_t:CDS:2 [Entrophospora sp. SA101]